MRSTQPAQRRAVQIPVSVLALTVLALVVRVIFLGHKGLWQDEIFSVLFARPSNADFWPVLRTAEANMALYYLALREWMRVFTSDAGVRLLSVIPGVLSIPVIYELGNRLYSRRAASWAARLMTINTCAVVYSQEARGYSMLVLFAALSSVALLEMVERDTPGAAALYVVFTVCAFYCHFYAVFVILAQGCALWFLPRDRRPWRSVALSWIVIALAMIPGLRVILQSHGSNLWWLPRPGVLEIYRTITFLAAENGKALGAVLALLLLIPITAAIQAARRERQRGEQSVEMFRAAFAVCGLLVPMIATLVLSMWRPMFFHRFLIICLVPFLLLAGEGIMQLQRRRLLIATLIVVLSWVSTEISYTKVREDWRGAATLTLGERAKDPVIFFLKDGAAPFAFYRERLGSAMTEAQALRLQDPPTETQVAEWAKLYPSVSFVRFPSATKDPVDVEITERMTQHYRICERRALKGVSVSWYVTGDCPPEP